MSSRLAGLIDNKLIRLARIFLNNPGRLHHLYTVSQEAKVALGTTHRLMKKLVSAGLVDTIVVGKTKLYRLNEKNAEKFEELK